MANLLRMRNQFDKSIWKRDFADRLIALCPGMNPDAADEVSDLEFTLAGDTDPAAAALRWVAARQAPASGDALPDRRHAR